MANGKPGDHPITDMVSYGQHPFPIEIEELVRTAHQLDPYVFNGLDRAPFDWEAGRFIAAAQILLRGLIQHHGDPEVRRRLIREYHEATEGPRGH